MYFQSQQQGYLPPTGGAAPHGMPFPSMVPPPSVTSGRGPWPGQQQGLPPQTGVPGGRGGPQNPNIPPQLYGQPMPPNNPFFIAQAQAAAAVARGAARGTAGSRGGPVPGMANVAPQNMAMPMGGRPPVPPNQRPVPPTGGPRGNARPHLPSGPLPGQEGATIPPTLTSQALLAAPPPQQKQMLGEALYPKIHEMNPSLAGKITGMLLEMSNDELLAL